MLASLFTIALLASANAVDMKAPTRKDVHEHQKKVAQERHAAIQKLNAMNKVAVPADYKFEAAASSTSYLKIYAEEGSATCTDDATATLYIQYGACLVNYDGSYTMGSYEEVDTGYNVTTVYYSDAACSTAIGMSVMLYPSSCDTAINVGSDDDAYTIYVMGTSKSVPSNGWGYKEYNTLTACTEEDSSAITMANIYFFKYCYPFGNTGYSFEISSCNKMVGYSDATCTTPVEDDDDDQYGDDFYVDDDFFVYCEGETGSGMQTVAYDSLFCKKSAASMVVPSAFAAFAAVVVALLM